MMRSKSLSICNRSRARLVDSSWNRTFWRGYPNLMHSYGRLLEPRGSKLALLKSTFNAENFIRRLSWSISSIFCVVHCWWSSVNHFCCLRLFKRHSDHGRVKISYAHARPYTDDDSAVVLVRCLQCGYADNCNRVDFDLCAWTIAHNCLYTPVIRTTQCVRRGPYKSTCSIVCVY